jgi:hypothetical protein
VGIRELLAERVREKGKFMNIGALARHVVRRRKRQTARAGFERGILYIATGEKFVAEAEVSARSVKAVWPEIPIALITDTPPESDCFADVKIVPAEQNSRDKPHYISMSPFERTVFLDADTYCCAPFPEVFDLLDRYDLAAAYDDGRFTQRQDQITGALTFIKVPGVPDALPEFNTGVIAFRRSPAVATVFKRWIAEYDRGLDQGLDQGRLDYHDQPSFRSVIYRSKASVEVLPSEYNFRLCCCGFARNQIKIVHGRWSYHPIAQTRAETMQKIDRAFNASHGPRVFVPHLGMIYGHGPLAHSPAEPERTLTLVAA